MDNEPLAPPTITKITGFAILFAVAFITSLWLGYMLGHQTRRAILVARLSNSVQAESSKIELKQSKRSDIQLKNGSTEGSDTQTLTGRQRNILLIAIDNFKAEDPRLDGVWMILYLRDLPNFMLVPIYPNPASGEQNATVVDQNLARVFKLNEDQTPGSEFLQALKNKELWWNGYLILDRSALSEIMAMTSSDGTATRQQVDGLVVPETEAAPMQALLGQARLAQELCRNSGMALTTGGDRFPQLIARASAYIHTDLDLEEIVGEVRDALRYSGGISCEFPSLATAANLP